MPGQARLSQQVGRRAAAVAAAGMLLALTVAPSAFAADPSVTFVSGTYWTVTDEDAGIGPSLSLPGAAQHVCLNATAPSPCPAGAAEYGWPGGGWGASLASIPGAAWIWAPGIGKDTTPADNDTYRFSKTINVPGTPVGGSVSVAADDGATVYVNGTSVGGTSAPDSLATRDISAQLIAGDNLIQVVGRNGPICGSACPYQRNPGGVVFGGTISYEAAAPSTAPSAAPSQAPGATQQPGVTTPPTSTVDPAAAPGQGSGPAILLFAIATVMSLVIISGRRAGRRQR